MPTFLIGFTCAIVLMAGSWVLYDYAGITMTEQTASNAVHVEQKSFTGQSFDAREQRKID